MFAEETLMALTDTFADLIDDLDRDDPDIMAEDHDEQIQFGEVGRILDGGAVQMDESVLPGNRNF